MLNYYYKDSITSFLGKPTNEIIGTISRSDQFDSTRNQNKSWVEQIEFLKQTIQYYKGTIFFEFSIPRMGKRVDVILLIENVVFVVEFKVGESKFHSYQIEQVWDYALDLKHFHQPSHKALVAPILVATLAAEQPLIIQTTSHLDNLLLPITATQANLREVIAQVIKFSVDSPLVDEAVFDKGSYLPTPTIIEAAIALFNNHSVEAITRSDAAAKNLRDTTYSIKRLIDYAKTYNKKVICFVTGVPGAGKTLVGLRVATNPSGDSKEDRAVYLSGNGPLVSILHEALARDKVAKHLQSKNRITKKEAKQVVKKFIQIIHHYRDACIKDQTPPYEHVAIFDEAQRAWNTDQTIKFMKQKKGLADFSLSEPEFLISCLDRHKDWAVIVCLVGGGQEINTGEAGISEWLNAIHKTFTNWEVAISSNLTDSEYSAGDSITRLKSKTKIVFDPNLHLNVSMRSFRAENVSRFIKLLLELNGNEAQKVFKESLLNYPIILTRDLGIAKRWLKEKARGSERYGLIVSSQAQRLKPFAIDVKSPIDPVHWFLDGKDDIRSSFFMEDVATEFQVQGLELDWACVTWDGDLRYSTDGWKTFAFKGSKWQNIHNQERKKYLVNAYRVLLTRARQGMIIVVPEGNNEDHTRKAEYYDGTFDYLKSIGIPVL